jgi:hypothetical protein
MVRAGRRNLGLMFGTEAFVGRGLCERGVSTTMVELPLAQPERAVN